jgi:transposase-like protein
MLRLIFSVCIFGAKKIMEDSKHQRRKFTAAEISEVLKKYRQSGKNRQEFCDLEGISYSSLGNWIRAEKKSKEKNSTRKPSDFISLDLKSAASTLRMQINFPGGRSVSFFTEPDPQFVRSLLV